MAPVRPPISLIILLMVESHRAGMRTIAGLTASRNNGIMMTTAADHGGKTKRHSIADGHGKVDSGVEISCGYVSDRSYRRYRWYAVGWPI
jgi:hypothetical protein